MNGSRPRRETSVAEEAKETKETKETKPVVAAPEGEAKKPPAEDGSKKKKLRPTNCAQSNKRIRRKDWYYRDGKYFANKQCYHLFVEQETAKKEKEAETKPAGE